ncbi:MAG: Asp-tRNA(Asn)/Glu-tRNA(Gln) amidotransferase subunit GatC [Oscillospiraceae bacterium]|nr:Asp-tRNA(Asn)/Glu-tRNA(Gln) amidotransferase subunit GatC [Oscillospiraceae bacterium]
MKTTKGVCLMYITKDVVLNAAFLSRIKLDEKETEEMQKQMSEIVEFMDILNQVDTDYNESLMHTSEITNVMREDETSPSYEREDILKNAPCRNEEYFVVPKTVE